jgi:uncharacterized membrane protein YkvA (DUF1232 family)
MAEPKRERPKRESKKQERKRMKSKLREVLLFVPNLMRLLFDLLKDPRVSPADKAIVAGTIMYVIVPLDVIPDFIPFIGQVDDAYLVAISLLRLLNRTNRKIILDHWKGDQDIKELVSGIARITEFFLPKRTKNVLRGRIEPKGRLTVITDTGATSE